MLSLCEICEVHSKSLSKLRYDKYKCENPRCNNKGSHFHDVCNECCEKINLPRNNNQIKKSTSELESNKNKPTMQIFLNKMSDEPESIDEKSKETSNLLARRIERNFKRQKIKERSQRDKSSK